MILGIVRPLIACAILIGLVLAGRTTETYNVDPIFYCAYGVARADARAADVIKNWIRTRTTLEFLGTWEKIYNPVFKVV